MFSTFLALLVAQASVTPLGPREAQREAARRYGLCAAEKARNWAKSTEPANVIVDTAVGACKTERAQMMLFALQMSPDDPPGMTGGQKVKEADEIGKLVDDSVRNLAYQAVIEARTPRNLPEELQ